MTNPVIFDHLPVVINDQRVSEHIARRNKAFNALFQAGKKGNKVAQKELKERWSLKIWNRKEIERVYGS